MPIKELKGFKRTFIGKGETKKVKIELKKENLRYWDDAKKAFVTPKGNYLFMIGSSSEDIRLKGDLIL